MKFSNWKDVAEIVGILTIVASLIFVGLELRQSQRIAIASQYQSRIGFNLEFYDSFDGQETPGVGDRLKQQVSESNLPAELKQEFLQMESADLGRQAIRLRKILLIFDNNQYQYQAGFVDEETWQSMRGRMKGTLQSYSGIRKEIMMFEIVGRSYQWRESFLAEFQQIFQELEKGN